MKPKKKSSGVNPGKRNQIPSEVYRTDSTKFERSYLSPAPVFARCLHPWKRPPRVRLVCVLHYCTVSLRNHERFCLVCPFIQHTILKTQP